MGGRDAPQGAEPPEGGATPIPRRRDDAALDVAVKGVPRDVEVLHGLLSSQYPAAVRTDFRGKTWGLQDVFRGHMVLLCSVFRYCQETKKAAFRAAFLNFDFILKNWKFVNFL